ncbi:GntR family transcriptional regulator [Microbacterium sp. Au-Mic1]|uniref:GntR family transcriptional regulator n=1 Tax=Microbacterium sp. Au-Mic1 TaxID=2906457 RepID=UPI001E5FDED0|nr:GntR family transcriptional regulator [Microbacterium sp. Au-Mic1]MCE4026254.1 GntR family transcriptional regulator [Microbacterium sp. Au-Mic1]
MSDSRLSASSAKRNLGEDVYESIKQQIMSHAISPGARVNIDRLSRVLDVSQTPIRQALARLESEGLVEKQPSVGYSATQVLTRKELEDLYDFRLLTEPWAAARAAALRTGGTRESLETELAKIKDIQNAHPEDPLKTMLAHDARFHDLILSLAGNEVVRSALDRTHSHLHLFRLYSRDRGVDITVDEHVGIASAINAGDQPAAARAMREHIESSRARTIQMLQT